MINIYLYTLFHLQGQNLKEYYPFYVQIRIYYSGLYFDDNETFLYYLLAPIPASVLYCSSYLQQVDLNLIFGD